jgi:hypothetical protein
VFFTVLFTFPVQVLYFSSTFRKDVKNVLFSIDRSIDRSIDNGVAVVVDWTSFVVVWSDIWSMIENIVFLFKEEYSPPWILFNVLVGVSFHHDRLYFLFKDKLYYLYFFWLFDRLVVVNQFYFAISLDKRQRNHIRVIISIIITGSYNKILKSCHALTSIIEYRLYMW